MSPALAAGTAERAGGTAPDQRHRPEHTLLYQIVEQHYPAFDMPANSYGPLKAAARARITRPCGGSCA